MIFRSQKFLEAYSSRPTIMERRGINRVKKNVKKLWHHLTKRLATVELFAKSLFWRTYIKKYSPCSAFMNQKFICLWKTCPNSKRTKRQRQFHKVMQTVRDWNKLIVSWIAVYHSVQSILPNNIIISRKHIIRGAVVVAGIQDRGKKLVRDKKWLCTS